MNSRKSSRFAFLTVLTLVLAMAASAAASLFLVVQPGTLFVPSLRTYNQSAADWWKWVLAQPADKNPLVDTTGVNCGRGQPFLGTFYLAGAPDSTPVTRNCTVPNFRTLLIPVVNGFYGAVSTDPAEQRTEAFARSQLSYVRESTDLSLTIDGTPVQNLSRFYEESSVFSVTLPNNNIFGAPSGTVVSPAVDAGYYVGINGLLPGKHVLKWHGVVGGVTQDVTYNLTVKLL
jgi:hypothetical protein